MAQKISPHFHIEKRPNGFDLVGDDHNPVHIDFMGHYFHLTFAFHHKIWAEKFGLVDIQELATRAVFCAIDSLTCETEAKSTSLSSELSLKNSNPTDKKAVTQEVITACREMIVEVDPVILETQRHIFAVSPIRSDSAIYLPALYQDKNLVMDVAKYPVAALAATFSHNQILTWYAVRKVKWLADCMKDSRSMGPKHPMRVELNTMTIEKWNQIHLEGLHEWRSLYSPTGFEYPALNKTLMNLPAGIPGKLLHRLNRWTLHRKITNRVELLFLLAYLDLFYEMLDRDFVRFDQRGGGYIHFDPNYQKPNFRPGISHIIENSNEEEIHLAMAKVGQQNGIELPECEIQSFHVLVEYLCNFPGDYNGNLAGLVERAIRWHTNPEGFTSRSQATKLDPAKLTRVPPIPLPQLPEIRFLKTVGEIRAEGVQMEHCVGACSDYAHAAMNGEIYLFHVVYQGEQATVEVEFTGSVLQSRGPKDCQNAATDWGNAQLSEWGSVLSGYSSNEQVSQANFITFVEDDSEYKDFEGFLFKEDTFEPGNDITVGDEIPF